MFSLSKPSPELIRRFLDSQKMLDFTYHDVGATAGVSPAGFSIDHTRVQLGVGGAVFQRGKRALDRWEHFSLGWIEAWPADAPIHRGEVVAVVARAFGQWSVNASRIVYVVDQTGPTRRYGFAYGTLPGHVESGEERFIIEWDQATGTVWYDILAFSRPRHVLARIGYPLVRRLQKRFGRESAAAMVRAAQPTNDFPEQSRD
jgi:uncharacterized protein (UPF0548 family)